MAQNFGVFTPSRKAEMMATLGMEFHWPAVTAVQPGFRDLTTLIQI